MDVDDDEGPGETASLLGNEAMNEALLQSRKETVERMQNEVGQRWLLLLFFETLVLLVVQVGLGLLAGSLALLADSAHSAVDVVTYGFNWWIEWHKSTESTHAKVCGFRVRPWKVDAFGSGLSLIALIACTCYVVVEAIGLLGHDDPRETSAQYRLRGSALFAFAVISTLGNVLVLLMYRKWQPSPEEIEARAGEISMTAVAGTNGSSNGCGHGPGHGGHGDSCSHGHGHGSSHDHGHSNGHGHGDAHGQDQSNSFGHGHGHGHSHSHGGEACTLHSCATGKHGESFSSSSSTMSLLHSLVHPGCQHGNCDHALADHEGGNLNLSAAMLHLISDILRGVTIFIVAVLIECHAVRSAERADTVCALLVSAFILVGALALFQKVFTVICYGGGENAHAHT